MLKPILIQINPLDNVAIVVNDHGLEKQTVIEEYQLTLVDDVPQGHKVLLKALKKMRQLFAMVKSSDMQMQIWKQVVGLMNL